MKPFPTISSVVYRVVKTVRAGEIEEVSEMYGAILYDFTSQELEIQHYELLNLLLLLTMKQPFDT